MPVVWPSLHSIAIAYWPTRLIAFARTLSGTVLGSSSGRPDVSSMHSAHRQARRRSRARYLVSWPSAHLIVIVDRSRPTISSGIGTATSPPGALAAQQQLEQRRGVKRLQEIAVLDQRLDLADRDEMDTDVLAGVGRGRAGGHALG